MIQRLIKYKTEDGSLFDSEQEAVEYEKQTCESEKLYKFIQEMQDALIHTRISERELHRWLKDNAKEVRGVLKYWDSCK